MAHSHCKPSGTHRCTPRGRWLHKGGGLPKAKTTARR